MQITNPPMCLKFDVKNGENLDKTLYNAFAKNGSRKSTMKNISQIETPVSYYLK
jgi:hypothetical protein